ncbi:DUF2500 domain-containing protein [Saccharibacillus endophyticus]
MGWPDGEFRQDINGNVVYETTSHEPGIMERISGFFDGAPLWFVIPFILIMVLITLTFVFGIGSAIIKSAKEKRNNEAAGILTVPARVFGKREEMRGGGESRVRTVYHLAFELENGERKEFQVEGERYGVTAEGDSGMLTFMGTKFEKFERAR